MAYKIGQGNFSGLQKAFVPFSSADGEKSSTGGNETTRGSNRSFEWPWVGSTMLRSFVFSSEVHVAMAPSGFPQALSRTLVNSDSHSCSRQSRPGLKALHLT